MQDRSAHGAGTCLQSLVKKGEQTTFRREHLSKPTDLLGRKCRLSRLSPFLLRGVLENEGSFARAKQLQLLADFHFLLG